MPNECQNCEFGKYVIGGFELSIDDVCIECFHWDRPDDPFFIRASDPTPKDCPKEPKNCPICHQLIIGTKCNCSYVPPNDKEKDVK